MSNLWICHVITLQITTQGPRECLDNLKFNWFSSWRVKLLLPPSGSAQRWPLHTQRQSQQWAEVGRWTLWCPGAKRKWKLLGNLSFLQMASKELCYVSYIKDERRSVIGGSDDAPHKPTSLPDQGGHLINNWSTPGPSPGTQSCQPHPPPGPPPPPPSARATAPQDYWPPPPRCGWRSAGRGPGMLSVEQAQVLAKYSSRASKQFLDSQ